MKIKALVCDSRFFFLITVIAVCAALLNNPADFFAYHRDDIFNGQYWRLISGHFTHNSSNHLYLNLAAWLLIWIYGYSILNTTGWVLAFLLCAILSSLGFLVLLPDLYQYSGLSGVLHGSLVIVAIFRLRALTADFTAWLILLFIIGKLIYEALYGPSAATQNLIDLPISTESHLYGVFSGLIVAGSFWRRGFNLSSNTAF